GVLAAGNLGLDVDVVAGSILFVVGPLVRLVARVSADVLAIGEWVLALACRWTAHPLRSRCILVLIGHVGPPSSANVAMAKINGTHYFFRSNLSSRRARAKAGACLHTPPPSPGTEPPRISPRGGIRASTPGPST